MSQTFTLTGHKIVLSADFYPPIELNTAEKYVIALTGFYTYNSIFNVTEKNNSFAYRKNDEDPKVLHFVSIPPGAYEIDEIERVMLAVLRKATRDQSDDLFSLKANNNTLKCELKTKLNIIFPRVANSIGPLLGFGSELLKSGVKHQSVYNVDIMKVRIIRVDCNITAGAYLNSSKCHTIF